MITPLLKNNSLEVEYLINYRPVYQLIIFHKIIEKILCIQLNEYITNQNILNEMQSAYTKSKSTETALTLIVNDLLQSKTNKAHLVLLDLSAAFDTLDHIILINRLYDIGIISNALELIKPYITQRTATVNINEYFSTERYLKYGIPQGSVMGPILFNVYIIPIFKIIDKYKLIKYHLYADDLQLYIESSSENDCTSVKLLNECINEITEWFNSISLKINPEKTKIIYINLKGNSNENNPQLITINNIQYKLSDKEKNLGVLIDKNLNMLNFINAKIKSANYQLHTIRIIRKTITFNTCKLLI